MEGFKPGCPACQRGFAAFMEIRVIQLTSVLQPERGALLRQSGEFEWSNAPRSVTACPESRSAKRLHGIPPKKHGAEKFAEN